MYKASMLITALIAFGVTAVSGIWLIPYLRRLKYGQTILDIGPNWHKSKQGTPTMGGFMFILGITIAVVTGFSLAVSGDSELLGNYGRVISIRMISGIVMASAFSLIGFADDYVKVSKKRNLGLTARQKLVMQFLVAAVYLWTLYSGGDRSTVVQFPFWGQVDFGLLYYPLCAVGIVYIVNSVNLTDGLDGLASSVTFVASLGFMVMADLLKLFPISLLAVATAAACLGFLVWNFYPAKVFMGDTGSMYLGGLIVALAFGIGMPMILIFTGIIYIVESMSVVLQVISFKSTGKRIFKMSPIHHHFEMSGYNEVQIVLGFSAVTLIGVVLAVMSIFRL